MFSPLPCLATLSRSIKPRKPDSRANSGVISGKPIGLIESTSIAPSSMRYRAPTLTCGRVHIRAVQGISLRRTAHRLRRACRSVKKTTKDGCYKGKGGGWRGGGGAGAVGGEPQGTNAR